MHEKWSVYDDMVWDDYGGGGMGKHDSVMEYISGFDIQFLWLQWLTV